MTIKNLYQQIILSHNKEPRNFKVMQDATYSVHGKNPLCGDDYYLYVKLDNNGLVEDVSFYGSGCAISKASGSLMTEKIKGKPIDEVIRLKDHFIELVTKEDCSNECTNCLGEKICHLKGVQKYPIRVKCATLVWRALEKALVSGNAEISTE